MADRRLIEDWLPIAALSEESIRERRSMTALPPTYYLHVWWARRPLVASRAAVLASLLPADADRQSFLHALGIHGDPVQTRARLDRAKREKKNLGPNPYGYKRAFSHTPDRDDTIWIRSHFAEDSREIVVLDPTAGGGSIPFETGRLGLHACANDLNPVAALILRATIDWPRLENGGSLLAEFEELASRFVELAEPRYRGIFPKEPPDTLVLGYLWARTVRCPHCTGVVPLSPNWRLAADGTGVRVLPDIGGGGGGGY